MTTSQTQMPEVQCEHRQKLRRAVEACKTDANFNNSSGTIEGFTCTALSDRLSEKQDERCTRG